ncbi:MAG TPA: winged helix-turn-helix domain-containing protein, partial [Micavibrio sp.]
MTQDFLFRVVQETAARHGLTWNGPLPGTPGLRLGALLDQQRAEPLRHLKDREPVILGPYRFFPAENSLETESTTIRLTEKERDILLLLLDAVPQSVTRQHMLDAVWGYASGVETHTLETHIYRL